MLRNLRLNNLDSTKTSETFSANGHNHSRRLMNKLAHILITNTFAPKNMSGREEATSQAGYVVKVAKGLEKKQKTVRGGGKMANGSKTPRTSVDVWTYKPKRVENHTFVQRTGAVPNGKTPKSGVRRKSIASPYATVVEIHDLKRPGYEKNNSFIGNELNLKQPAPNEEKNTLPPLTRQLDNWSLQSKTARLKSAKERHRSLSGQAPSASMKIDGASIKNQRSASVDYSSAKALLQKESRSSSFVSGRYSQMNGKSGSGSFSPYSESPQKPSSAHSAFSASRQRSATSVRRHSNVPSSTLDVLETVAQSNCQFPNSADPLQGEIKTKKEYRSHSVYSPSSVASAERFSRFRNGFNHRRSSLPNPTVGYQPLAAESTRSPEFFKTLHELEHEVKSTASIDNNKVNNNTATNHPPSSISSAREPQRREILQKIEEVLPESTVEGGLHCRFETNAARRSESGAKAREEASASINPRSPHAHSSVSGENGGKVLHFTLSESKTSENVKTASKPSSPSLPARAPERSEGEPKVASARQSQRSAAKKREKDNGNEASVEWTSCVNEHFSFLANSDFDCDFVDESVVYKDDDDLCDDDFHEKRMILWLKSVKTGEEATTVTRTTPPPTPDLSCQESAIRVVYDGGNDGVG